MDQFDLEVQTVRVLIAGRVQNVWFRGWTEQQATMFGLDGWVRNLRDGKVEALFSGSAEAIASMLDACNEGPSAANVSSVERFAAEPPVADGFSVLPTA
jgi:acylphosphatase